MDINEANKKFEEILETFTEEKLNLWISKQEELEINKILKNKINYGSKKRYRKMEIHNR